CASVPGLPAHPLLSSWSRACSVRRGAAPRFPGFPRTRSCPHGRVLARFGAGLRLGSRASRAPAPVRMVACLLVCSPARARGTRRAELTRRFPRLAAVLHFDGGLWVAWPKRTAGVATDLCERDVREVGLAGGLVDNKVCAVDDVWSSLRFVYRLSDRPPSSSRT